MGRGEQRGKRQIPATRPGHDRLQCVYSPFFSSSTTDASELSRRPTQGPGVWDGFWRARLAPATSTALRRSRSAERTEIVREGGVLPPSGSESSLVSASACW